MSFDTGPYANRKDRRKPYRGSKSFDRTCRNHGSCPWCADGRMHRQRRQEPIIELDGEVVVTTEFVSDW